MSKNQTNRVGRPSKYQKIHDNLDQIEKLAIHGFTNAEIADFFGIHIDTFCEYQKKYPEFSETLKNGKALADTKVMDSLFHRACGYSHSEEKIFCHNGEVIRAETTKHYPPDTTAIIYWLRNRRRWLDNNTEIESEKEHDLSEFAEILRNRYNGNGDVK